MKLKSTIFLFWKVKVTYSFFIIIFLLITVQALSQSTTQSGNWSASSTWTGGNVPTATSGSIVSPVMVGHNITLDQDLNISTGVFFLGHNGVAKSGNITASTLSASVAGSTGNPSTKFQNELTVGNIIQTSSGALGAVASLNSGQTNLTLSSNSAYTVNSAPFFVGTNTNVTDQTGATFYNLNLVTNGGYSSTQGILDIKSGVVHFEGTGTIDNTTLIVRTGAKLIFGPTSCSDGSCVSTDRLLMYNNSKIKIERGAELIVNGSVKNYNNGASAEFIINGTVDIRGNYSSPIGNTEAEREIDGVGVIMTTGTLITNGSSTVFGYKNDCVTGPCTGDGLGCNYSIVTSGNQNICDLSVIPQTLTSTNNQSSPTYEWQSSTISAGLGWASTGVTTQNHPFSTPLTQTTWFRVKVTSGTCASYSNPILIRVGNWIGISEDWNSVTNWQFSDENGNCITGPIPNSTKDVVISKNATYMPKINGITASVNNLFVNEGATITLEGTSPQLNIYGNVITNGFLNINSGTVDFSGNSTLTGINNPVFNHVSISGTLTSPSQLIVNGNFTNNGIFNHNNGTVSFNGSAPSSITGSAPLTTFQNMFVSNTAGVNINKSVDLLGTLNLGNGALFNAGTSSTHVFSLRSTGDDPVIDASIGSLLNGAQVTGNVRVERHMSPEGRFYRYLSSPVSGSMVSDWMDDFPVTGRFPDRHTAAMWPSNLLCNNVTLLPNNASLFYYDETVQGDLELGYVAYPITNGGVASTNSPLERGRGYAAFIRLCNTPTIVDVRGSVHQGEFNLPVSFTSPGNDIANDGWNLVGNPYPSSIDWDITGTNGWVKTNISNVIAITDNGGGNKLYWDGDDAGGNGNVLPGGIIATGQAFWVKAIAANPVLTIREGVKVADAGNAFYRKKSDKVIPQIKVSLSNNGFEDRAFIKVRENTLVEEDAWDATKLKNETFGVSTVTPQGMAMAINAVPEIKEGFTFPIRLDDVSDSNFKLQFTSAGNFEEYAIELTDYVVGIKKIMNWGEQYAFVTSSSEETEKHRFTAKLVKAQQSELQVMKVIAYPNPVNNELKVILPPDGLQKRITIFDQRGVPVEDRLESGESTEVNISFNFKPSGVYLIRLLGKGYSVSTKVIKE